MGKSTYQLIKLVGAFVYLEVIGLFVGRDVLGSGGVFPEMRMHGRCVSDVRLWCL